MERGQGGDKQSKVYPVNIARGGTGTEYLLRRLARLCW
jgi:hypothetical protein